MALFVMALVAAIAVAMTVRLRIDIHRTSLLLNADQAYLIAQGSIAWAEDRLSTDLKQEKANQVVDHTPIISKPDELNGFQIQSTIVDAQSFFNLNNLVIATSLPDFIALLKVVDPKISPEAAKNLATAIQQWLTPGALTSTPDPYYANSNPPYSPAHHAMVSLSELRLVKGMTPALYASLEPYVIALPESTPINVNTAPVPVLMSLDPKMTAAAATAILNQRTKTPFTDPQKFQDFDAIKTISVPAAKITLTSRYFLVKTSVKIDQQETILYTLLKRTGDKSKPVITALWQTKGAL
jgi:general secretion pathway protein K